MEFLLDREELLPTRKGCRRLDQLNNLAAAPPSHLHALSAVFKKNVHESGEGLKSEGG